MQRLLIAALVAPSASFASTPAPEGTILIRDSYQFDNAKYPMTGFTPDSDGPHKLVVVLPDNNDAFFSHLRSEGLDRALLGNVVAMQGHGAVFVDYPDKGQSPDFKGAAEFFAGNFSGARSKGCAEWDRRGTAIIAGIIKLCGRDEFDCSSGIALLGFSQGNGMGISVAKLLTLVTPALRAPGSTLEVNAILFIGFGPLLGSGRPLFEALNPVTKSPYLLPPHPLALHWCGFDDAGLDPPAWSTVGDLASVSADKYPLALSTFVHKTKRRSLLPAQDYYSGNPTQGADPAATASVFSLQRDFSGYDCPDTQNDCIQADGSGYFVVPSGTFPLHEKVPDGPTPTMHGAFLLAFVDDAFIGEKWHSAAALKWLGDAAFGA